VGPPGIKSNNNRIVLEICDHLRFTYVASGDLLKKEISKKSDIG